MKKDFSKPMKGFNNSISYILGESTPIFGIIFALKIIVALL
jgi:hypothetical protein